MDKLTLAKLIQYLPGDATEISIKGHDTKEILFCSNEDFRHIALPAQKGTYSGTKNRWKMSEETIFRNRIPKLDPPKIPSPAKPSIQPPTEPPKPKPSTRDVESPLVIGADDTKIDISGLDVVDLPPPPKD
jgi:hypothetical protein